MNIHVQLQIQKGRALLVLSHSPSVEVAQSVSGVKCFVLSLCSEDLDQPT